MSNVFVLPSNKQQQYRDILQRYNQDKLLVFSASTAIEQLKTLKRYLPTVTPHYAIKSCPHPTLLQVLADNGCCFDVATIGEIQLLRQIGVSGSKTIHTHPIKNDVDILAGIQYGTKVFVVDNICEINKFVKYKDQVKLLLRVSFPNPDAAVDLSRKFGCVPENIEPLLLQCQQLGLSVVGLSFHVGSQAKNSNRYLQAIDCCVEILNKYDMRILDIGGGFPIEYHGFSPDLEAFFGPINAKLQQYPDLCVISEPGRFISAPTMTCISTVVGVSHRIDATWYYLNDGVYGSYSGVIFDHINYNMLVFSDDVSRHTTVLTGPTCDSIDVVVSDCQLPLMNVGDLVVGLNMGAYTMATSTSFNCIDPPMIVDVE